MTPDETAVRTLVEQWAQAVHRGDLATVLAAHDDDVVMFDVPPPEDGVRGIAAYRDTWPGFFRWQRNATFDLLSLDVVAGDDVAFAYGLLRCGTPQQNTADPARRLRLTIGLRKVAGRWTVTHEHHSFTARD
jgi:uncharacterized protein (TIGR02246 family)